ncbi:DUF1501 domain-containing protein [Lignipirellula cremea]|uniref:DUF1501 domain-containing protein n=1 Tax=Lignipirellula cremea TaxID=2528010 RepID=A0A518DXT6_9BACT|nr:DUF1501 domain-containing protein [Lignipirellula cremea]QDU96662.1 hypothetical protein Pla8534_44830 [Lignipirellula cremea]
MQCRDAKRTYQMGRRQALQVGTGLFGLSLYDLLHASQAQAAATGRAPKEMSCIFFFLAGGPSHFETFDPKPEAESGIRGLWGPTSTSVPGTFICEKMPQLAQLMHKVALVRSWQGIDGRHDGGSQHVMNGFPTGPESNASRQHYPNMGCLVSALQGARTPGVPPHVGIPVAGRYTDPPGYLGKALAAFDIKRDPLAADFQLSEQLLVGQQRLDDRRQLLSQMDQLSQLADAGGEGLHLHDHAHREAFDTLTSGRLRQAARLEDEPAALRERYGMTAYGQRVLLSRRLIEAGVRFVTINQAVQNEGRTSGTGGTWDNHDGLFEKMLSLDGQPGNLVELDRSLSALIEDLDQRGRLETTLIVVMGEFGRTPRINSKAGRDHYPKAGSVLLAGGGISGGVVVGATDRQGAEPNTVPHSPADFAATIYHALGIDAHRTYFPRKPRPTPIADGHVIKELFV